MTSERQPDTGQLALERTALAAERTLFAALRTGLAIAGGGSLVITLLADAWPTWVQVILVATFLVVGYGTTYAGLGRYRTVLDEISRHQHRAGDLSVRAVLIGLAALQLAILTVVILFLIEAFET